MERDYSNYSELSNNGFLLSSSNRYYQLLREKDEKVRKSILSRPSSGVKGSLGGLTTKTHS